MVIGAYSISAYWWLNYHKLLMAIGEYFIGGYW
jgi:hypothetical protein